MKPVLPCFVVALVVLATLAHAVINDPKPPKPIQILHMPRVLFENRDLGFMVRLQPIDSDRLLYAILCNNEAQEPCSLDEFRHERLSQLEIEGDRAAKLWTPKPWAHLAAGSYTVVVTIGPRGGVRASDALSVLVQGM